MGFLHEIDGKVRPQSLQFLEIVLCFIQPAEMTQCRDKHCIARSLEMWLLEGFLGPLDSSFIVVHEQVGVRHADQEGAHVRIAGA